MKNPWTLFFDWYKGWSKDLTTTSHIIISGVALSIVYVLWLLAADTFCQGAVTICKPVSPATQDTLGFFLAGMLYGGVAQFAVKRKTDRETEVQKAAAVARATVTMPAVRDQS